MSSDTDSSSSSSTSSITSSSSDDKRKQKKYKKRKLEKKKSQKNKKKASHKEKKRRKLEKPLLMPIAPPRLSDLTEEGAEAFGPALPPHLLQTVHHNSDSAPKNPTVIGPQLPAEFQKTEQLDENSDEEESLPVAHSAPAEEHQESDDDIGTFGPTPVISSDAQIQLEQRALELKIATLEGRSLGPSSADEKGREEWMLELPEVGLKGGLAALNNMKRSFYQGKERPDFSDRSSWTKTPNSGNKQTEKPTTSMETLKATANSRYERERDAEQERIAKKHKKKHKREESLMEMHQKKMRKEEKKKAKELAASGAKPERRPFSRDVDLKLNKIDSNQTKQIVDKAKILDSKFSSGRSKYL